MVSQLNVRQMLEAKEEDFSPFAAKSRLSRGRHRAEEQSPVRTDFQRDRDRIIHSKAFRRLKHKTQVFIAPIDDHYVTRLTHTLEVAQIARTISRALNLNEDLTEAIALGHDLGHTPFGHTGEDVLNELYQGGFRHNEQSLRIIDLLENNGQGLNLTWEVRDGILNHSKTRVEIFGERWGKVSTLEGEVCKIADAIAYINHDIDDAVRAEIISEDDLPPQAADRLGHSHSKRINTMVCDIISHSWQARGDSIGCAPAINMSAQICDATNQLNDFLHEKVYKLSSIRPDAEKARRTVRALYLYYRNHQDMLPPEYLAFSDEAERRVVDYIASMTDNYAQRKADSLGL